MGSDREGGETDQRGRGAASRQLTTTRLAQTRRSSSSSSSSSRPAYSHPLNTKSGRGVEHDHTFRKIQMTTTTTTTDHFCRILTTFIPLARVNTTVRGGLCVCATIYITNRNS